MPQPQRLVYNGSESRRNTCSRILTKYNFLIKVITSEIHDSGIITSMSVAVLILLKSESIVTSLDIPLP